MPNQFRWPAAIAVTVVVLASACTASPASPGSAAPSLSASGGGGGEGGGEGGGGVEAALVTYADAAQQFSIGYPGPWTRDQSVVDGVKFVGGDHSLTLQFVRPTAGTSAMAYGQSDVAAVSALFPGYSQLSLAASTEVAGAVILGFEADAVSAVTSKAFRAHDERYYMPLADGRIAVLTITGPADQYDREGVRDIALTFKVTG